MKHKHSKKASKPIKTIKHGRMVIKHSLARTRRQLSELHSDKLRLDWLQKHLGEYAITPACDDKMSDGKTWWLFHSEDSKDASGRSLRQVIDNARNPRKK